MKLHLKIKKFTMLLAAQICVLHASWAQGDDFLRSTGKIYSVVAVIAIVFIGIALFLYRLDNKLTKLENQSKHEQ